MSNKKKLFIIQVEARDTLQLAGYLNVIGKAVHDGFREGTTPTYWSIKEKEQ